MPLTAQDVAEITRLLEESDFDELHLEQDGLKLTLRRAAATGRPETPSASQAPASRRATSGASAAAAAAEADAPVHGARGDLHSSKASSSLIDVAAPLVGIFYRAPRPGAPPYVEVGASVEEDTIVGIIEVMKLMNAVRAEVRGTVSEILVKDGAAVEYGQVLLRVEPAGDRG
ncbi:MAG: acetyl-CoA carboxylase biotin carboxyl carrier protein [Sinobacteraceae bacterium]|nr:acetyl-CoA carboxylase biotin carboxyl carrier protein [Nevskiaceae bacterium]